MELYDVGFASMFVQEADALATLADLIGRSSDAAALTARADSQRRLIAANLWDPSGGIFTNRFWNGTFYRRITPTSFYSMMAKAATDAQAEAMAKNWLLSPEHFCIAPGGDFVGNSDDCYWGLPSIQKADPAFPPLGYWRGYVWGPMAQLTYWSLQYYDHVPLVRTARKALCKQMTALMLSQWRTHRHPTRRFTSPPPLMLVSLATSARAVSHFFWLPLRLALTLAMRIRTGISARTSRLTRRPTTMAAIARAPSSIIGAPLPA
jgi:putative isomerase